MRIGFVFLFLFMVRTSKLVLFPGSLYNQNTLVSGAQTIRPGWAGPVGRCLVAKDSPAVFLTAQFCDDEFNGSLQGPPPFCCRSLSIPS
jgi:hypothetical protein